MKSRKKFIRYQMSGEASEPDDAAAVTNADMLVDDNENENDNIAAMSTTDAATTTTNVVDGDTQIVDVEGFVNAQKEGDDPMPTSTDDDAVINVATAITAADVADSSAMQSDVVNADLLQLANDALESAASSSAEAKPIEQQQRILLFELFHCTAVDINVCRFFCFRSCTDDDDDRRCDTKTRCDDAGKDGVR